MEYDLDLDKVTARIKAANARTVCIQLPDGLKPRAGEIADALHEKTGAVIIIWSNSCFGACDPAEVEKLGVDLLVQWGHSAWQ